MYAGIRIIPGTNRPHTALIVNREWLARDRGWGAMSEDSKRDVGQVVSLAARWRKLERETIDAANEMADPEAKRRMLFVAQSYRLIAERIELRAELLEALEETKSGSGIDNDTRGNDNDTRGKGTDKTDEAK
jgi:hypothetical protein